MFSFRVFSSHSKNLWPEDGSIVMAGTQTVLWGHRVHRESISQSQLLFLSNRQQQTDRPHPSLTLMVTYMPSSRRYQTNHLASIPWWHDDFAPMDVFLAFHNVCIITIDLQHDSAAVRICVCLIVMLWGVCIRNLVKLPLVRVHTCDRQEEQVLSWSIYHVKLLYH